MTSPTDSLSQIHPSDQKRGHMATLSQATNATYSAHSPDGTAHNSLGSGQHEKQLAGPGQIALSSRSADAVKDDPVPEVPQSIWRDCIGEFFGTMILVLFGDGSLAQLKLSNGSAGDWGSVSGAWGLALALGVLVAGKSGGHLNPAVTLTMAIFRKFPLKKVPSYFLAQFLGALIAAAIIWGNYRTAIRAFEGGAGLTVPPAANATAGIFATYPAPFMTEAGMFFSEILATCLLVFLILALTDKLNPFYMGRFVPVGLFFVFWGITACFGYLTGFAVNPARDFGPRVLTAMVGYGSQVWTVNNHYFVVPFFAPFFGGIFAGFFYDIFLYKGTDSWCTNMVNKYVVRKYRSKTDSNMA